MVERLARSEQCPRRDDESGATAALFYIARVSHATTVGPQVEPCFVSELCQIPSETPV